MKGFLKGFEKNLSQNYSGQQNLNVVNLASKYGVPFVGGKANAGCPGIVSPLGETPAIELFWGSGASNQDKTDRFYQFSKVLVTLETYNVSHNTFELEQNFKSLNVHGRVMFLNIAAKQNNAQEVLNKVQPVIYNNLDTKEIPYGKGGATNEQILNKYVSPIYEAYKVTPVTSTTTTTSSSVDALGSSLSEKLKVSEKQDAKFDINNNNRNSDSKQSKVTSMSKVSDIYVEQLNKFLDQQFTENWRHTQNLKFMNSLSDFVYNKITIETLDVEKRNIQDGGLLDVCNSIIEEKLRSDLLSSVDKQSNKVSLITGIERIKSQIYEEMLIVTKNVTEASEVIKSLEKFGDETYGDSIELDFTTGDLELAGAMSGNEGE